MSEVDMRTFTTEYHRGKTKFGIADAIIDYELEKDLIKFNFRELLMYGTYGFYNLTDEDLKNLYDSYYPNN